MLDSKEFIKIRKDLEGLDNNREAVIQQSREIITLSKKIIYAVQRDDMKTASTSLKDIEKKVKKLSQMNTADLDTNIAKVAFQEYVEAATFHGFMKNGKLPSKAALKVSSEDYLLGLCDLTGEFVRKAVNSVIKKKYKEAEKIKDVVDEIYGEFLQFNLRNGELRKKSDQIKWNLKKLEDVVYELKLKGKLR